MGFRLAPGDLATSIIALALVYGAVGVFIGSIAQATSNKSENAWAASMAFFAVLFALSHSALGVWVLITSGAFGVIVYHASRRAAVTGPAPTRHLD
jgi:succinate dehydrogenase hydrophobic anchor subunit